MSSLHDLCQTNRISRIRFTSLGWLLGIGFISLALALPGCGGGGSSFQSGPTKASVGQMIFNDTTLSTPPGQSCASCHSQANHFTDARKTVTSEGAVKGRFGSRQAPSAAYMAFSPKFHFDATEQDYLGGQFWDGRAGTLEDQAKAPFLNPSEMNNANAVTVVAKVKAGPAAAGLKALYGANIFDNSDAAYSAIVNAIAEFERTSTFAPFSSKYDAYLKGQATLSPAEARGLQVFNDPKKGNCAACHPSAVGPHGEPPLFTDFSYDNLGLPKNPKNPFYTQSPTFNPAGAAFVDEGLYNNTKREIDRGRFKVPTLRNLAQTGPYFHNGVFSTLEQVVLFYNTRDLGGFAPPEEPRNENHEELGNLGLTSAESSDLVEFLKTLTDGYTAGSPFGRP